MVMMGRRALALKGLARKVFARDPDEADPPSSPPWASPASDASLLSRPLTGCEVDEVACERRR